MLLISCLCYPPKVNSSSFSIFSIVTMLAKTKLNTFRMFLLKQQIPGTNQEPLFQYGYSAQAANKAADEHGIAYFTSARNFGSLSWENRNGYKDTECRSDLKFPTTIDYISCHDFNDDDDNGPSPVQNIIIETDGDSLQFFWEDTWRSVSGLPGAQTDLDLFLFNGSPFLM